MLAELRENKHLESSAVPTF